MRHVPKRGSLIPFEFTQRKKSTIFLLRNVGLLGRGGGNSFKRAVTDDDSTMQDIFFPYQCGSRHAEEIHESVAEPTDIRKANSRGFAGRALEWDQQTRRIHVEWRVHTGGEVVTGLKCKCCSHPSRLLEEYLSKLMKSSQLSSVLLRPCSCLIPLE